MTIEERIQELRKSKGLSQEQLAETLGVSRQAVSKWESGQSMPEVEKLLAMSSLFDVSTDYILKGEPDSPRHDKSNDGRIASQIISAAAAMLLAIAILASVGQLADGESSMGIYEGLILESVAIMILLVGWFIGGSRVHYKPLFVVNILLAGLLPASYISQTLLGLKPLPMPPATPAPIILFIGAYLLICGITLYFTVIRKKS